jgi:hypothetical protein
MQKMLRRTVTVGTNYALHIVTIYLFALCSLLALMILSIGFDWQAFVWIAGIVCFWTVAGIFTCMYTLSQIDGAVEQIRQDTLAIYRKVSRHG